MTNEELTEKIEKLEKAFDELKLIVSTTNTATLSWLQEYHQRIVALEEHKSQSKGETERLIEQIGLFKK